MKVRVNGVTYDSSRILIMVKFEEEEKVLLLNASHEMNVFASFPDDSIYDEEMVKKMMDDFKAEDD